MEKVRPKKSLGQHFLIDQNIARNIASALSGEGSRKVLEVGPGMGILTRPLLARQDLDLWAVELDSESYIYLKDLFPEMGERLIYGDFLKLDLVKLFGGPFNIIGNFPYNISSQIFFRALALRDQVPEIVGMVQREVAQRMVSQPSNKVYGILTVLLQAFYDIEILFFVGENVFNPPPKVKSAVVRLKRNQRESLGCQEALFFTVVKTAFNQRRKTLSNALKPLVDMKNLPEAALRFMRLRAEQLSIADFIELTGMVEQFRLNIPLPVNGPDDFMEA